MPTRRSMAVRRRRRTRGGSIRSWLSNANKWLRKHKKLAMLGEHVHWQPRKYPTDGNMLKVHDNVAIASNVEFTMHDIIHWIFDGMEGHRCFQEFADCIEINENVFIGAGARILPGVSVGPNAIVAAGAIVNKDVLPGTVVGGVPARVIGSFEDLMKNRKIKVFNCKKR